MEIIGAFGQGAIIGFLFYKVLALEAEVRQIKNALAIERRLRAVGFQAVTERENQRRQ